MCGQGEDLSIAKERRSEGFIAKSWSIEIVYIVLVVLSENVRAFLQDGPRTGAPPSRAVCARGPCPTWAASTSHACARCAHVGRATIGFPFFNSKLANVF